MITLRAGKAAIGVCLLLLAGCSREQQDWRSAEAADSIEAYDQFIQRHPESELATQARTRVAQLGEDRDWQHAGSADSVEAYRQFITQHPNGKWAQEARIRIENFSLGEQQAGSGNVGGAGSTTNAASGTTAASARRPAADAGADGATRGAGMGDAHGVTPATGTDPHGTTPRAAAGIAAGSAATTGSASNNDGSGAGGTAMPRRDGLAVPGEAAVPAERLTPHPAIGSGPATGASGHAGAYGIQLGAFSSEAAANTEWRLLTGRFGPQLQGLSDHVVMAETASGRIYRLEAVVGEESRARAICDYLRKSSQPCVAVLPH